jgi:integrase
MARSPTETIRFLSLEELARLFAVARASPRDRALFLIAYRHGLRASEVGLLRTDDIDFRALRIMVHRLKGSHSGAHPMQPDEVKALRAHLRGQPSPPSPILFPSNRGNPIARRTLDWLMKRYGEAANLPPATVEPAPASELHGLHQHPHAAAGSRPTPLVRPAHAARPTRHHAPDLGPREPLRPLRTRHGQPHPGPHLTPNGGW